MQHSTLPAMDVPYWLIAAELFFGIFLLYISSTALLDNNKQDLHQYSSKTLISYSSSLPELPLKIN